MTKDSGAPDARSADSVSRIRKDGLDDQPGNAN